MNKKLPHIFTGMVLLGMAATASAHPGHPTDAAFSTGFMHPLTGWDHMAAMLAVGMWGAVIGGRARWLLPIAFPLAMLAGTALGVAGVGLPAVETWIASSALILGLAVALLVRPALWVAVVLTGIFAVFHGHAHGAELPAGSPVAIYIFGFLLTTVMLHLAGMLIGMTALVPRGTIAIRTAGGAIAALGAAFLVGWL